MNAFFARLLPAKAAHAPAPQRTGLARFDDATRAELDALPPRVRCAVVKDRKLRVTRELERFVASGGAR